MFLYNALVVDMEYAEDYEKIQSDGTIERSLNGNINECFSSFIIFTFFY